MQLLEAQLKLQKLVNKPLGDFLSKEQLDGIIKNKGKSGQLLEVTLGMNLSNTTLDFDDGELKTNKCDKYGKPKETMFITQVTSIVDDLLTKQDFYHSKLYRKIRNLLYVPISKDGHPSQWMYLPCVHVDLNLPLYSDLKNQLEKDYYNICDQLNDHILSSKDHFIHTSSGKFIQIRSKDSKPYHPIYSEKYKTYISNKNHAFYFKKEFMQYITELNSR